MKFDDWVMTVPGSVKDLQPGPDGKYHQIPLITEVLYTLCNGDVDRFKSVMELMKLAYEAGGKNGQSAIIIHNGDHQ
jgi:hypothetical protein